AYNAPEADRRETRVAAPRQAANTANVIVILKPDTPRDSEAVRAVVELAARYPGVTSKVHEGTGATRSLIEVDLIGSTTTVPAQPFEELEAVERVVRVSEKYRIIGRHRGQVESVGFTYQGLTFDQEGLHVVPGLCAVDTIENVDAMFRALSRASIATARMGAY